MLKCFCQSERGQCDCMSCQACYMPTNECVCVIDATEYNFGPDTACECVLYPATSNAPGYVSNTIDVLRRGAT